MLCRPNGPIWTKKGPKWRQVGAYNGIIFVSRAIILMHNQMKTIWPKVVLLLITTLSSFQLSGQEKKPTLMILPSDNWCTQRYFITTFNNQGFEQKVPNYSQAFREDTELPLVISKIGQLLTDRGYSLKDAEQETKAVFARMAEDNVTMSKTSSSSIAESPLDMIKKKAKMDIIIQIDWKVNREAAGRSVSFTLEAFDAYTSKRIATSAGVGPVSNDIVPLMLENAVKSNIKAFDKQLMAYYKDMQKQGREIVLSVKRWENGDIDLETEFDGEELLDCIQAWLRKNTIGGNFNLSDATENQAYFEQVRIPLYDEYGDAMDARSFAVKLRKYLSKEYDIVSKVMTRGLGEAIIVLGEK